MANLTFELKIDDPNVRVRELSIDVFSTFNISDFSTGNPLEFKTDEPIRIFPGSRQIEVKVRADATIGSGWELKISFNSVPVPENPIKKAADASGRANREVIVTWVSSSPLNLLMSPAPGALTPPQLLISPKPNAPTPSPFLETLAFNASLEELKSMQDTLKHFITDAKSANKAAKGKKTNSKNARI